jgi:TniQ
MKLGLTIPPGEAETPVSFTSRLAAANGLNARAFCLDWDLRFKDVIDGDKKTIATIAELGGVDAAALMQHAFVHDEQGYEYRTERLVRTSLRRIRLNVCPVCLLDDIDRHPNLRPHFAAYGRAVWLIEAVRTCHVHDVALSPIGGASTAANFHDFAFHARASLPDLQRIATSSPRRRPAKLEAYIFARLNGARQSQFLDDLPLFAAIKTCEIIGMVSLHGPRADLKSADEEKWRTAGACGFEIAAGGSRTIVRFLDEMKAATADRNRKDGICATFGRVYTWLSANYRNPVYAPVRAVVAQYIRENFALDATETLFGAPIERRTLHSIRTLSLETGLHPKKLRKTLRASGIVGDHQIALSDHAVVFDAVEGSRAAKEAKGCLYLPAVRVHLNASRSQVDLLVKHGFIKPHMSCTSLGAHDQYAIPDLDDFLGRLMLGAQRVNRPTHRQVTIPRAAKQACCSAADVVRLILEKRLAWVGRLKGVCGYNAVLVNVDQVRTAVLGPGHGGLPLRTVAQKLGTTDRVVTALIEGKHLATFTARNPVNRCMQTLVAPAELARFQKTYVSLHVLARERKRYHLVVKPELDAAGIKPAFDHEKVGARFYRRSEC